MARIRELMLSEPGMFMRMFRDLDPSFEPRVWPFAGLRKALADFPWMPELEMKECDHHLMIKLDLPGLKKEDVGTQMGAVKAARATRRDCVDLVTHRRDGRIRSKDSYKNEKSTRDTEP